MSAAVATERLSADAPVSAAVPDDTWVVIPAYNEGSVLADVLERVLKVCRHVVVVDDGSRDETHRVAATLPVHLLRHRVNLGQGAALQTGVDYAIRCGAEFVCTFDADGQMDENDIVRFRTAVLERRCDVALGSRFLGSAANMPPLRRLMIRLAVVFTRCTTGLRLSDTHNGFRLFTRSAALQLRLKQNRMAHASEILSAIAQRKFSYVEVPVTIRYTDYSLSKGQSIFNLVNILWELTFH